MHLMISKSLFSTSSRLGYWAVGQSTDEKLVWFVICVYTSIFLSIYFNPRAADGPSNMIYCRDLLLAHKSIDCDLFKVNKKGYEIHAISWLNPVNVAMAAY